MSLFPIFVDIKGKNVLIVGAGKVALRKIEKLLPFKPKITVIAKEIKEKDIIKLADKEEIKVINREFLFKDIDGKDLVIVAVDNIDLQREIFNLCEERKIPVNSVDSPDFCNFIFPAYIKRGDIVIGLTTSGKAPALSAKLRKKLEECLPEDLEKILSILEDLRKKYPKGEERQKIIINKLNELIP